MIGVALPSIRTDLHMSTSSLQWVVSAYVLGYGGFLLLGGRAADLLGRRRMVLVDEGIMFFGAVAGVSHRAALMEPACGLCVGVGLIVQVDCYSRCACGGTWY